MATEQRIDGDAGGATIVKTLTENLMLLIPLALGVALIVLGYAFDLAGRGVEAGVSAAAGLIICAIALFVYGLFWALGRYGH